MPSKLTVQTAQTIPCDGRVRDYDQLETAAKQYVAEYADEETETAVSPRVVGCFDAGEFINYTDYLRIEE